MAALCILSKFVLQLVKMEKHCFHATQNASQHVTEPPFVRCTVQNIQSFLQDFKSFMHVYITITLKAGAFNFRLATACTVQLHATSNM